MIMMRSTLSLGVVMRGCAVAVLVAASLGAARQGALLDAVKAGDAAAVRALTQRPGSARVADTDGTTALHWAVERGEGAIVDLLIKAGADVNAVNRFGVMPLAPASENGDAAMVQRLIKAGADPKATLAGGETLLMTAARTGDVETIKALLAAGLDVNAREKRRGQTALIWAASQGNSAAIRTLVEAGADITMRATGPESAACAGAFGGGSTGTSHRRATATVTNMIAPTARSCARTLAPSADAADPTRAPPVKPRLHMACSRFMIERPSRFCTIRPCAFIATSLQTSSTPKVVSSRSSTTALGANAMSGMPIDKAVATRVSWRRLPRRSINLPTSSAPMMPPRPPPSSVAPRPALPRPSLSRISGMRGNQFENVAPFTKNKAATAAAE